jgi:serine/threonine protein kinase
VILSGITMDSIASQENVIAPGALVAGKYRLDRKLGEGGMGAVFLAHNEVLQQRVVIKAMHGASSTSSEAIARFLREARAAAKIQNEHVARVLDFGTLASGAPYLVMEFLEGQDLEQELEARGVLPVSEAIDHVLQALDGLAVAHEVGIVHRDIKPANLFLAKRQGGGTVVKILDFGIAKSEDDTGGGRLTTTRGMMGSPLYMSPEQYRSAKYVGPPSDIWSMGVVMYQLVTGRLPFEGEGLGDLVPAIMSAAPAPPRSIRSDNPAEVERTILACLEKDAAARPAGARALANALAPFGSVPPARASDPSLPQLAAAQTSSAPLARWFLLACAVGVVGLAAGGIALAMRHRSSPVPSAAASSMPAISATVVASAVVAPPEQFEPSAEPPTPSASASSARASTASAKKGLKPTPVHTTPPPPSTNAPPPPPPPANDFDKRR